MHPWHPPAAALLTLLLVWMPGCDKICSVQQEAEDMYCEMVSRWKDTNGREGWPDFEGGYQEVCK